ncbi:MAG TPA: RIO1 family regulatory kinase/ATPase [Micromonosporaceae bacterium]|nr:RIO1 family regulatory kinase/ATPase [Micromonosporaceae bacterium]
MREHDLPGARTRRQRFDDDEPYTLKHRRQRAPQVDDNTDAPEVGSWTSWDAAGVVHGPEPYPDWLVTELAAVDVELGLIKTGKEADVHLVERGVPGTARTSLLAAKRYRSAEHRMFHRDSGYLEGRRVRESRVTRAMAGRTSFGRQALAGQWASAEFAALVRLWELGSAYGLATVPYPVQVLGTELMLEFIGDPDGTAAPRLAQLRPEPGDLADLWRQLVEAMTMLARAGLAHGDLSPYNILVFRGRLVLIDLPQVVDVVTNPRGPEFLARDVAVVAKWFAARGLAAAGDPAPLTAVLLADAGVR